MDMHLNFRTKFILQSSTLSSSSSLRLAALVSHLATHSACLVMLVVVNVIAFSTGGSHSSRLYVDCILYSSHFILIYQSSLSDSSSVHKLA